MLLCYLLAMFGALAYFQWIVMLCVLGAGGWLAARTLRSKNENGFSSLLRYFCTPSFVGFLGLLVFFYFVSQHQFVQVSDDVAYWAVEVRSLFAHGGLVDSIHHLSPNHMTYTPGVQLWQWIGVTAYGEWNEHVLFFVLWFLYASFLLPFGRQITWKKLYWLPVLLVGIATLPSIMNVDAFSTLRVDTLTGICLGYALIMAWRLRSSKANPLFHLVCFSLALCALVLIKQIGAAWALMAVCLLLFVVKPRKTAALQKWQLAAGLAGPVLVFISWLVFCRVKQLSGTHATDLEAGVQSMVAGTWSLDQLSWPAIRTMVQLMLHTLRGLGLPGGPWLELPRIAWVILFALLPLLMRRFRRADRQPLLGVSILTTASFFLFMVGFIFLWHTAFSSEVSSIGRWASEWSYSLMERYFCPFTIGWLMLLIFDAQEQLALCPADRPAWKNRLCCVALAALFLLCDWTGLQQSFFPAEPLEGNGMESLLSENFWIDALEEPEEAVVLYGIESYPRFQYFQIQYVIAPSKLVLTKETELTEEAFLALLKERQITHIVCMDDANTIYRNAQAYAEDGWMDVLTPYAVHWEDDLPVLSY